MKRILSCVLALSMMFTFAICAQAASPTEPNQIVFLLSSPSAKGSVSSFYVTIPANGSFALKEAFSLGEGKTMEFVSANPKVATVDAQGIVTWKSAGQTQINLSAKGANTVAVRIICSAVPTVAPSVPDTAMLALQLKQGASFSLSTNMETTYNVADAKIATVDDKGLMTWKSAGQTALSVSAKDAGSVAVQVLCSAPTTKDGASVSVQPDNSGTATNPSSSSESSSSKDETTVEIEDDHDQRKWNVGAGIAIDDYYEAGASWEQVLADVQALATPYGLTVTESGFIGNGSSNTAGNVAIGETLGGNWYLTIYAWRSNTSETGLNKTMNVTLQVMKYFLGDDNGANLWSLWDAIMTGQNPNMADYGLTDANLPGEYGALIFSDGTQVGFSNQSHQFVWTLA